MFNYPTTSYIRKTETPEELFKSKKAEVTNSAFLSRLFLPIENHKSETNEFYAYKSHDYTIISGSSSQEIFIKSIDLISGSSNASDKTLVKILTAFYSESRKNIGFINSDNQLDYNYSGTGGIFISLPMNYIAEGIKKGSLILDLTSTSESFTSNITDDGNGNLFDLNVSSDLYNYTGSVFYGAGVIFLPDHGNYEFSNLFSGSGETLRIRYNSVVPIREKLWKCTVPNGELNYTLNKTSYLHSSSASGTRIINNDTGSLGFQPYITSIGLYNSKNEMIAIAKLSKPLRKSAELDTNFIIKIDL